MDIGQACSPQAPLCEWPPVIILTRTQLSALGDKHLVWRKRNRKWHLCIDPCDLQLCPWTVQPPQCPNSTFRSISLSTLSAFILAESFITAGLSWDAIYAPPSLIPSLLPSAGTRTIHGQIMLVKSTGNLYKAIVPRFGEFCLCCCLPPLPQLACSILATWEQPSRDSL